MARYIGALCRLCRREGGKLFLKGDKCYSVKCPILRRTYAPGQHGLGRKKKLSEYGIQLREKQKARRIYGLTENQFRLTFGKAERMKGITGENLLITLERRLDNVIYRMGMADNRNQARQMVRHGFFLVKNTRVNIPSYLVKINDDITVAEDRKESSLIKAIADALPRRGTLAQWMEIDTNNLNARISRFPNRDEIIIPLQEQLIVELYSR